MARYVAGVDIGGTNTKIGIVSDDGTIIAKKIINTRDYPDADFFKKTLADIITELSFQADIKISAVGIGAPNANTRSSSIEYPPNLPWKGITDLRAGLDSIADVFVTNDANAAAIGEKLFGAAKGFSDFIVVTLGTGIGGGIFCDSKLLHGKFGFAGEIGHTIAVPDGRKCNCGRNGCIEKYCSAGGIVQTALDIISSNAGAKSVLSNYKESEITSKIIAEAAHNGDKAALETFDITAKYLAAFSNNLLNIFSLEAIIFSGGVIKSKELLFLPLEKYFRKEMLDFYKNKNIKLLASSLPEQDAAIIGAASLAL